MSRGSIARRRGEQGKRHKACLLLIIFLLFPLFIMICYYLPLLVFMYHYVIVFIVILLYSSINITLCYSVLLCYIIRYYLLLCILAYHYLLLIIMWEQGENSVRFFFVSVALLVSVCEAKGEVYADGWCLKKNNLRSKFVATHVLHRILTYKMQRIKENKGKGTRLVY